MFLAPRHHCEEPTTRGISPARASDRWTKLVVLASLLVLPLTTSVNAQPARKLRKVDGQIRMQRDACRFGVCKDKQSGRTRTRQQRDEFNVIIRFDQELTQLQLADYEDAGVRFMRRPGGKVSQYGTFYAAWVSDSGLELLDDDQAVHRIEAGMPAHMVPTLDRSIPEIQADLRHMTPVGTDLWGNQGEGVVIADFEVGGTIDVTHPDFFKATEFIYYDWIDTDGNGLFLSGTDYVDLNKNGSADPNERLAVHEVYIMDGLYNADIDWLYNDANGNNARDTGSTAGFTESSPTYGELLFYAVDANKNRKLDLGEKLVALGQSKIKAVLRRDGSEYVRGSNLINTPADLNGHGTSVSSILLGQDRGYNRKHVGVAPDAELLYIEFNGSDEANQLDQVLWAKENGANVFLWEFGGWTQSFLDGSSFIEEFIAEEMLSNSSLQVTPNGNLASSGRHARGSVAAFGQTIQSFDLPDVGATSITISVLWQGDDEDCTFGIRRVGSPTFAPVNTIIDPADYIEFEDGHYALRGGDTSDRGTARFDIQFYRLGGAVVTGGWELQVTNTTGSAKTIDYMIKDSATTWNGGVAWTSGVTDAGTLCRPATSDYSLNVASYGIDSAIGQLSYFSSRGPTMAGLALEGIAAPGHHDIFCGQSSGAPGQSWAAWRTNFGGTSAAGPHVAGAAALLMSAIPEATPLQVYEAILSSGAADANTGSLPNDDWGWGKLRINDAYYALAGTVCSVVGDVVVQSPADGAVDLETDSVQLTWQPSANAQMYDVHFGTSNPPPSYLPNINLSSYPVSSLEENTTYYWQVYAKSFCGYTAVGPVRSFVTGGDADGGGGGEPEIAVSYLGQSLLNTELVTPLDTPPGQQTTMTFLVENNGSAPLEFSQPVELANNFQGAYSVLAGLPDEIEPFGLAEVEVVFAPVAGGAYFTALRIYSNDFDESTFQVLINGTAPVSPQVAVSYVAADGQLTLVEPDVPVSFEETLMEEASFVTFSLENLGDADLLLEQVEISGLDADAFSVSQPLSVTLLAPGDAPAGLVVMFTPSSAQMYEASLSIGSNDPDSAVFATQLIGVGFEAPPEENDPIVPDPIDDDPIIEDPIVPDPVDGDPIIEDPIVPDPIEDDLVDQNPEDKRIDGGEIEADSDRAVGQGGGGGSAPCGAGAVGMMPLLLIGLCSLRQGGTRRLRRVAN